MKPRQLLLRTVACCAMAGSLALLGAGSTPAAAAPKVVIKLALETGPGSPYYAGAQQFAKDLEKIDPAMQVQVFPNSQLGSTKDIFEDMNLGTVQMTITGDSDAIAPESGIFALPFLFANRKQAYTVLDAPVTQHIFKQTEQHGVLTLAAWDGGFRYLITTRPVNSLKDLQGMKIRVPPLPVYIATFRALGTNATPMAFGQVYTALQQHTVDGVENSAPVLLSLKFDEVAHYLAITHHVYTVAIIAIGGKFFHSLTPEQRAHIKRAVALATASERKTSAELEARDLKAMQSAGVTITHPDLAPFRKAVEPLYASYEKKYPTDMATILKLIGR
ncbi:MAG: TRAP transporter substrate-binding protein [Rhodospirillales bacterium]|nr:TRAP transporter substrate-binding protein [Rhodospirillales bacterium]